MRAWIPVVVAASVLLLPARTVRGEESCEVCHPDVRTGYAESVHAHEFACSGCHKGNPTDATMAAHDAARGYVGKPARKDIPALCASCHADPARMKPYGLPTDQYAQYQTSQHGILLAKGDERVAVCTDCHSAHRVVAHTEPTSPVSPRNIPETCGRCHGDAALMAAYKLPVDQAEKFRASVHGNALFVDEHPMAPSCASCHGEHGAAPPEAGSIARACGHCHQRTREYLESGPHLKAVTAGAMTECVSCHGYHDIARPDHTLFDRACPQCHAADTAPFATGQKLKAILTQTESDLAESSSELAKLSELSPTVARLRPRLQQGWAHYNELLPVQHALDLQRVGDLARSARSVGEEVRGAIHGAEQHYHVRLLVLGLVWLFVLFAVAATYLYRGEHARERAERGDGVERE